MHRVQSPVATFATRMAGGRGDAYRRLAANVTSTIPPAGLRAATPDGWQFTKHQPERDLQKSGFTDAG
jgi:hypothetical protein